MDMLIPAYVNSKAGSAQRVLSALAQAPGFDIRQVSPGDLPAFLQREIAQGTPRVLVAGGDGTLARAASTLAGTTVALSVLPGGTLNHFARNHGIPLDPTDALALAVDGAVAAVDVGYVNGQLFLNTSCVGAYTRYVRTRELIEPALGYWVGSVAAGARVLLTLHDIAVILTQDGATRTYEAPFVFVGVQERGLGFPGLGRPIPQGARGLHVVAPRGRRQARRFARALARRDRNLPLRPPAPGVDAAMVHELSVRLRGRRVEVALDGELRELAAPLEYRFAPAILRIVTSSAGGPVKIN
jgi:diacylglycerol kinase family enzyme